jgi:hypothetical protein
LMASAAIEAVTKLLRQFGGNRRQVRRLGFRFAWHKRS